MKALKWLVEFSGLTIYTLITPILYFLTGMWVLLKHLKQFTFIFTTIIYKDLKWTGKQWIEMFSVK